MKMRSIVGGLVLLSWITASLGCASGPKFDTVEIPSLTSSQGRIYFYRDGSPVGSAVQPMIRLNGQEVGKSTPGGFFYVDTSPGNYEVACSTEAKKSLTFTLDPGQKRYVRTRVSMGLFVGHVTPSLEEEDVALQTLSGCSYTGQSQ